MSITHSYIRNLLISRFHNKKISIVDYGCGNGDLLNFIDKNIKKYVGYEISDDCLKVAQNKFKHKKYSFNKIHSKKVPKLGAKNSVDLVILIGVIQYMTGSEISQLLKEAKKVLKKNGILIITCAVDHKFYKIFNIYQLFLPNNYINRKSIIAKIEKNNFTVEYSLEKGVLIAPFFSNIISFFFDAIDRVVLNNRGKIGPVGSIARKIFYPFIKLEYKIPIDYGYTLYIVANPK